MKIFSGTSNILLAKEIAKELAIPLSPVDVHVFPDGERRIQVTEPVVDEDCVVVQSAATPVDTNYMELFFVVDALKRSGAKYITAVVPYFGYQRQDHVFRDGEAVSLEVVIKMLETVGVNRLISFDMHSIKIPEMFHIPVNHLSALPLFAQVIKDNDWNKKENVLVSPDMGGIRRIKILSELLDNMPFAAIEKNRDLATGTVTADNVEEGSVEGKKCAFLVDDMISSGGTIITAIEVLRKKGIEKVYVMATHPVFSADAPSRLEHSLAERVYVANTVTISNEKLFGKLKILSVAKAVAKQIRKEE